MTDLPNDSRKIVYWMLGTATLIAASATTGYITAYERRLSQVEIIAATTSQTQVQRGERFVRIENRLDHHEEILSEIRNTLRELNDALEFDGGQRRLYRRERSSGSK